MAAAFARPRVKGPRPRALDVAASALVRVLPRRLEPLVDQARLDARMVVDGLRGTRTSPYSSHEQPAPSPVALRAIDPVAEVLPRGLAERYRTLRRDIRMVTGELRGHRAPMLVTRERAAPSRYDAWLAPSVSTVTRSLEVVRVIRETEDARTLELRDASGVSFSFEAGQFLTLHVHVDGVEHRRAYSISSSPDGGDRVRITVKRIAGGRVSRHLVEGMRVGARLAAHGPSGSFVVPAREASHARRLLLVAGGSGITPIASIVRDTLANDATARITLVYGNRSEADVIFGVELDALAAAVGPDRLELVHVLERPRHGHGCVVGVPDRETLGALIDARRWLAPRPGEAGALVMTCGPAPMMAAVREAFEARGVPAGRILEEKFLSPGDPSTRPRAAGPQLVTLRVGGASRDVTVAPDQTVLEAALAAGVPLPFSCQMGGCGACRCTGSGELVMDEPNCLSEAEKREGYVLTCVSRALGPASISVASTGGRR